MKTIGLAAALAWTGFATAAIAAGSAHSARFDWFEYPARIRPIRGAEPGPGEYRNPILQGFYPDPSITRAGDDYYLVTFDLRLVSRASRSSTAATW